MTNKDVENLARLNAKLTHGATIFKKVMAKKGITVREMEEANPWLVALTTSKLVVEGEWLTVAGRIVPQCIIVGEEGQIGKAARASAGQILHYRRLDVAKHLDDEVRQAELVLNDVLKRQKANTLANKRRARKKMLAQLNTESIQPEHRAVLNTRMDENNRHIEKLKEFIESH